MADMDLRAVASRRIVYDIPPGVVRRESSYTAADGSAQALDVYYPPPADNRSLPAVLIVTGYPDAGMQRVFGRVAKDLGSNTSWAELLAASGMAAVTYVNVEPVHDAIAVLEHLRRHAVALGIDSSRIGLWSCSGNVPNALAVLVAPTGQAIRCAALLYGYTLDLDGSTIVKEMSVFGFVTPANGHTVTDVPSDVPLLVVRAGRDEMPRLNENLDMFIAHAIRCNLPITVVNHRAGDHAFDAVNDTVETRSIIRQVVTFLAERL